MDQYFPRWLWGLLLLAATVWMVVKLNSFLVLLGVSYLLAYLIEPVVVSLIERRVPRAGATLLILMLIGVILFGVLATVMPLLIAQAQELAQQLPRSLTYLEDQARSLLASAGAYLPRGFNVREQVTSAVTDMGLVSKIGGGLQQLILAGVSLSGSVVTFLLLPLFVFYISAGFPEVNGGVVYMIPKAYRAGFERNVKEIDQIMSKFVRGQLTICLVLSVLYAFGFWVIGINLSLVIGVAAGFATIIPYAGLPTAAILSVLMSLVEYGSMVMVLKALLVCVIVQVIESFIVTPKIIGSSVGISPLMVLIALTVGGTLFGVLGMVLAVPGAAIANVLLKKVKK